MLKTYKPINHDIYNVQLLIEYLVVNVWCKADNQRCKTKLNAELKSLFEEYDWFKDKVNAIYKICKNLSQKEKDDFKVAFETNNKISNLCEGIVKPVPLSTLNKDLVDVLKVFFSELYTRFLGWKLIKDKYGSKKKYYDDLFFDNDIEFCPCCGYGEIKNYYSKGHSPFDHYLPQKHYLFSTVNFHNLVPLCHECNSGNKGETDIIENGQKVFYPFSVNHPDIQVEVTIKLSAWDKLVSKKNVEDQKKKLSPNDISVDFNLVDDRIASWDEIFNIKDRFFAKIASNRVGWFDRVVKHYSKYSERIEGYTATDAFVDVIEDDSDEQLGFLKSCYLENLKGNSSVIKAIKEVSGNSKIEK